MAAVRYSIFMDNLMWRIFGVAAEACVCGWAEWAEEKEGFK